MSTSKTIAANLLRLRLLMGYSQQYVGDLLNLSQAGYGKVERGEVPFTIDRLEQLSALFAVPLSELYPLRRGDWQVLWSTSGSEPYVYLKKEGNRHPIGIRPEWLPAFVSIGYTDAQVYDAQLLVHQAATAQDEKAVREGLSL